MKKSIEKKVWRVLRDIWILYVIGYLACLLIVVLSPIVRDLLQQYNIMAVINIIFVCGLATHGLVCIGLDLGGLLYENYKRKRVKRTMRRRNNAGNKRLSKPKV